MELLKLKAEMSQPPQAALDTVTEVQGKAFAKTLHKVSANEGSDLAQDDLLGEIHTLVLNGERQHTEATVSDAIIPEGKSVLPGEDAGRLAMGAEPESGEFAPVRKRTLPDAGFETKTAANHSNASTLLTAPKKSLATALSPTLPQVTGETFAAPTNLSANILASGIAVSQAAMPIATMPVALHSPPVSVIAELPLHLAQHVSSSVGKAERLVVQLDPPELGRVSIDFQYDARGMQQVLVTGESPEAVRQLRMMQAELVQSLERFGIGGGNLSFEQSGSDNRQKDAGEYLPRNAASGDEPGPSTERSGAAAPKGAHPGRLDQASGLDLRL